MATGKNGPKPTVVSIRPERELCGISNWGKHLEVVLERLGVRAIGMTHAAFLRAAHRIEADGLILHLEIGTDTKNLDVFRALLALRISRIPRSAKLCVLHSVFTPGQLHLSRPYAQLAVAYQWRIFRIISRLAKVVALTEDTHRLLNERGVENISLPLGFYQSYSESRCVVEREDMGGRAFLIGLIGHPYASKHYDDAARAFALLPAHVRARARIIVLGGDASLDPVGAAALRKQLGHLSADEYLLTGPLSEAAFSSWLDKLDLALMPYRGRSSSSAVLSRVVGHGIPAVTAPMRLFDPLVAIGGAVAVEQWPEEAAEVLERLIQSPETLREMRKGVLRLAGEGPIDSTAVRFIEEMKLSVPGIDT